MLGDVTVLDSVRKSLCLSEMNMPPCFSKEETEGVLERLPPGSSNFETAMLAVCRLMWVSGTEGPTDVESLD